MTPGAPLKSTDRNPRQATPLRRSPSVMESPSIDASARRKQRLEARKELNSQAGLGMGLPDAVAERRPPPTETRLDSEARKRRRTVEDVSGDEGGAGTTTKVQDTPLKDDRMGPPAKKHLPRYDHELPRTMTHIYLKYKPLPYAGKRRRTGPSVRPSAFKTRKKQKGSKANARRRPQPGMNPPPSSSLVTAHLHRTSLCRTAWKATSATRTTRHSVYPTRPSGRTPSRQRRL